MMFPSKNDTFLEQIVSEALWTQDLAHFEPKWKKIPNKYLNIFF